jgi:hypothetical protein
MYLKPISKVCVKRFGENKIRRHHQRKRNPAVRLLPVNSNSTYFLQVFQGTFGRTKTTTCLQRKQRQPFTLYVQESRPMHTFIGIQCIPFIGIQCIHL